MYTDISIYVYGYIYIRIRIYLYMYLQFIQRVYIPLLFTSVLVISSETSFNYRRPCAIHYGAP